MTGSASSITNALALARRIDSTVSLATQLAVVLEKGPYRRRRRRARKKLRKMIVAMSVFQRHVLSGSTTSTDYASAATLLDGVDKHLERSSRALLTKRRLRKIRRRAMRTLRAIEDMREPSEQSESTEPTESAVRAVVPQAHQDHSDPRL